MILVKEKKNEDSSYHCCSFGQHTCYWQLAFSSPPFSTLSTTEIIMLARLSLLSSCALNLALFKTLLFGRVKILSIWTSLRNSVVS